jgi:Cu/Ag efflux protein CusF
MSKLVFALGAAAMLALTPAAALAAEISGVVQQVDEHANTVTLEDGTVYLMPATFSVDTVAEGDTVQITYDTDANGQNVATEIVPQP